MLLGFAAPVSAHQWTPTYPRWEQSYIEGVVSVDMELFNVRKDNDYYSIQVLDAEMNPVPFVTSERVLNVKYLKSKKVEVFVRKVDMDRAVYICSVSRILREEQTKASVASRICSKAK